MKILVTVGCSGFAFDRLFRMLDALCDRGVLSGVDIIAQTGKISYTIRNFRHFDFASGEELKKYQSEADLEDALRRIRDFQPKPFVSNQQNFLRLIRSLI